MILRPKSQEEVVISICNVSWGPVPDLPVRQIGQLSNDQLSPLDCGPMSPSMSLITPFRVTRARTHGAFGLAFLLGFRLMSSFLILSGVFPIVEAMISNQSPVLMYEICMLQKITSG